MPDGLTKKETLARQEEKSPRRRGSSRVLDLVYVAMGAVILSVSAWVSFPVFQIPITLQTFGLFAILLLLGGKRGLCSVCLYLLLGAVGLPVFASFGGGLGVLFGPTGGFLWGFLPASLLFLLFGGKKRGEKQNLLLLFLGLLLIDLFGCLFFLFFYPASAENLWQALLLCVIPFLPFDLLKLFFAHLVARSVKNQIRILP